MYYFNRFVAAAIACLVLVGSANILAQAPTEVKITASPPSVNAEFGNSVCIAGDYAIVGSTCHNNLQGAAYIFKRTPWTTSWSQQVRLIPSSGLSEWFGQSVSISGDYALVAAPGAQPGGVLSGAAYVFVKPSGGWALKTTADATLIPTDPMLLSAYGSSVSISGDYAIVGSHEHDGAAPQSGAVYIFEKPPWPGVWGGTMTQTQKLKANDGASWDAFGWSVCISGDYAIVGAPRKDEGGMVNSGAAYVFGRTGTSWTQLGKLTAYDPSYQHWFGVSVSISGDYAIVGASGDNDAAPGAGAAYVFVKLSAGWKDMAGSIKLTAGNAAPLDNLGTSVSISGDCAIAGSIDARTAYYFRKKPTSAWISAKETYKLTTTAGQPTDLYATSVSISGVSAIVGAPGDNDNGNSTGAAYIYFPLKQDLCIPDAEYDECAEPNNTPPSWGVPWTSFAIWNTKDPFIIDPYQHENPQYGTLNYLHVHYRNRGSSLRGMIYLYYTKSSTGNNWDPNSPGPTIYGHWTKIWGYIYVNADPMTDYYTGVMPWYPPGDGDYCLLARFESTPLTADPMAFEEVTHTPTNVQNNNNITATNVHIVNKKKKCHDLIIRNIDTVAVNIALQFTAPPCELADSCLNDLIWLVDLGELRGPWQQGGGISRGMEPVIIEQDTFMRIIDPAGAWLDSIPFDSGAEYTICLQVDLPEDVPVGDSGRCAFDVVQYSTAQQGGDPRLDGGVRYLMDLGALYRDNPTVAIEKTHNTIQGQYEEVSITIENSDLEMGGFDFLIAYDASALTFMEATPGQLLEDCGWEYFTYRYGATGNCGDACPSGLLRIIAIAETNNGPYHPSCFGPPDTDPHELAEMKFLVTDDRTFECTYVPIRFFWMDCGDNTISSKSGDTLYVSDHVYEFEGMEITDATYGFPTYFGIQEECFDSSQWYIDPETGDTVYKVPQQFIDFYNGGIDIVCAESLDARGDINLNGVSNEVADAVLFSNYFIYGLGVFHINFDGQVAATDVNADGMVLTVGDLVYQIRIIVGDAYPYPKLTPVVATYAVDNGVVSVDAEMGAAYVVAEGDVTPTLLADNMEMKYNYDADENVTRILVYSMEKGQTFAGAFLDVESKVVSIEMATYEGAPVTSTLLPTEFALHQNFPNPFNPITTISFALPVATDYELAIYNVMGQEVAAFTGRSEPGIVKVDWDASNYASGVYLYKLTAGNFTDTKKMVLLK